MPDRSIDPLTVLVLDDRESSRYVLTTWLMKAGFSVIEASTGAEALNVVHSKHIDVALLDVNLPDMTGFEVCERIRADARTESLPVIHLSATAVTPDLRTEGLLRGADAYLTEPFEPAHLLATITSLLRRADLRHRAVLTANRLRTLNGVTADIHAASNDAQIFAAVASGAASLADSDAVVTRLLPTRGVVVRSTPAGEISTSFVDRDLVAAFLETTSSGERTLHTADPQLVPEACVGTPFVDEAGEPAGAILVPARADSAEQEVLPLLVQMATATTLARANISALDVEHRIALVLQKSLLPQNPPQIEGLDIVFRYVASTDQAEVGGDFYEALAIDDTHALIAIGDVVGHSLTAATVMGEIRHLLRADASEGRPLRELIERVDRLLLRFHPTMLASMICGIVDLVDRKLEFCNAGHPPPLYLPHHHAGRYLEPHGALVGAGLDPPPLVTESIQRGDRIVLVTDGLIELRSESIDHGLQRLLHACDALRGLPLDAMIDRMIVEIGPPDSPEDDIAVLAVEVTR